MQFIHGMRGFDAAHCSLLQQKPLNVVIANHSRPEPGIEAVERTAMTGDERT
jgi:hypothetical protein